MVTKTKKSIPAPTTSTPLYSRVREILESARSNVARTVNTTQVIANWLIGREIVEEEQRGTRRADYGVKLLMDLSKQLGGDYGRGYSVDNLEAFRQFYLCYPRLISETVSRKLPDTQQTGRLRINQPPFQKSLQQSVRKKSSDE